MVSMLNVGGGDEGLTGSHVLALLVRRCRFSASCFSRFRDVFSKSVGAGSSAWAGGMPLV